MKILLVEDNNDLALNVTEYLEHKGYIMDYSRDGLSALNLALRNRYDIILLDVMLPGLDGFGFCEQLRDHSIDTPVIMLTAKGTEEDKLRGFRAGVDDYMVKPFSLAELEARLQVHHRRVAMRLDASKKMSVCDLEYDPATLEIKRAGTPLKLNLVPRRILVLLMQNAYRVVTRAELEDEIWDGEPPDSKVLRSQIYTIRGELNKNHNENILHTIRGVGYKISDPEN